MVANLGDGGADPYEDDQQFQSDDHVHRSEHHTEEHHWHVLLAARCEEQRLVTQPGNDEERHHDDEQHRRDERAVGGPPVPGERIGELTVVCPGEDHTEHCSDEDARVQKYVERGTAVTVRTGHPLEGIQADRSGLEPVLERTGLRLEVATEDAPCPGDAEGLEEDGPEDELLVEDRFAPPGCDVAERPDVGRYPREECAQQAVQNDEFRDVDRVDDLRRPEAVVHPVERQLSQALHPRLLTERRRVDRRKVGCLESHGGPSDDLWSEP
ncbi:unannotated protein [freshwater metagenome]|uniref:Unannotated protein n=1 Tax=freshwater metagenome TaxID=449393 RepID=A0A6J7F5C4_9ZZZZ